MLGQLARYEEANVKLVLITQMKRGKALEVWGMEELQEILK